MFFRRSQRCRVYAERNEPTPAQVAGAPVIGTQAFFTPIDFDAQAAEMADVVELNNTTGPRQTGEPYQQFRAFMRELNILRFWAELQFAQRSARVHPR